MKILCHMDYGCASGFAQVAQNIIPRLARNLPANTEFDVLGVNYFGEAYDQGQQIKVYSAIDKAMDKGDFYGRDGILKAIREGNYDYLFILNDLAVISPIIPHLKLLKRQCHDRGNLIKYVFYFPVDSPCHPWDVIAPDVFREGEMSGLFIFDELVTYTEYGKKQVLEVVKQHDPGRYLDFVNKIKIIPHGTNTKDFYPIPRAEVKDFRRSYFKCSDDVFIIGQVNRNSSRKDVATSLIGYKMVLDKIEENNKDTELYDFIDTNTIKYYMHMNPTDAMGGVNLWRVCAALGLKGNNLMFPGPDFNENQGVTAEVLNRIYNCMDLFYTTTTAEGWGLSILEAMACKVPVVAPLHTSIDEITRTGDGYTTLIEAITDFEDTFFVSDNEFLRYKSRNSNCASALADAIYMLRNQNNEDVIDSVTNKAYAKACSYDWDVIGMKWASLFLQSTFKIETGNLKVIKGIGNGTKKIS